MFNATDVARPSGESSRTSRPPPSRMLLSKSRPARAHPAQVFSTEIGAWAASVVLAGLGDCAKAGRLICVLLVSATSLAAQPNPRDYENFDVRLERTAHVGPTFAVSASADAVPSRRSEYDFRGPLTEAAAGDLELVARRFLESSSSGFPTARSLGLDLETVSRYESRAAGLTHIVFRPTYLGIPYFDADMTVHLDGEGRVWRLNHDTHPFPPADLTTAIDARSAVERTLTTLGFEQQGALVRIGDPSGADRRMVFRYPGLGRIPISLVWFPLQPAALAAWQLYVESPRRAYLVAVDAATGEILFSRNLRSESSPLGRVFRAPDRAHPDTGGQSDEPLTGWPAAPVRPTSTRRNSEPEHRPVGAGSKVTRRGVTTPMFAWTPLRTTSVMPARRTTQRISCLTLRTITTQRTTPSLIAAPLSSTFSTGSTPCTTGFTAWDSTNLPAIFKTTITAAEARPATR